MEILTPFDEAQHRLLDVVTGARKCETRINTTPNLSSWFAQSLRSREVDPVSFKGSLSIGYEDKHSPYTSNWQEQDNQEKCHEAGSLGSMVEIKFELEKSQEKVGANNTGYSSVLTDSDEQSNTIDTGTLTGYEQNLRSPIGIPPPQELFLNFSPEDLGLPLNDTTCDHFLALEQQDEPFLRQDVPVYNHYMLSILERSNVWHETRAKYFFAGVGIVSLFALLCMIAFDVLAFHVW